jgi:hypothetical protein
MSLRSFTPLCLASGSLLDRMLQLHVPPTSEMQAIAKVKDVSLHNLEAQVGNVSVFMTILSHGLTKNCCSSGYRIAQQQERHKHEAKIWKGKAHLL